MISINFDELEHICKSLAGVEEKLDRSLASIRRASNTIRFTNMEKLKYPAICRLEEDMWQGLRTGNRLLDDIDALIAFTRFAIREYQEADEQVTRDAYAVIASTLVTNIAISKYDSAFKSATIEIAQPKGMGDFKEMESKLPKYVESDSDRYARIMNSVSKDDDSTLNTTNDYRTWNYRDPNIPSNAATLHDAKVTFKAIYHGFIYGVSAANLSFLSIPRSIINVGPYIINSIDPSYDKNKYPGYVSINRIYKESIRDTAETKAVLDKDSPVNKLIGNVVSLIPQGAGLAIELSIPVGKLGTVGEILEHVSAPVVAKTFALGDSIFARMIQGGVKTGTEMAVYSGTKSAIEGGSPTEIVNSTKNGLYSGGIWGFGHIAFGGKINNANITADAEAFNRTVLINPFKPEIIHETLYSTIPVPKSAFTMTPEELAIVKIKTKLPFENNYTSDMHQRFTAEFPVKQVKIDDYRIKIGVPTRDTVAAGLIKEDTLGSRDVTGGSILVRREDLKSKVIEYFGHALSLNGPTTDVDIYIDAAGAASILDLYQTMGKFESRIVVVAVLAGKRPVDILSLTFSQHALIGSGGYKPEDVHDVMTIMESGKWDIDSIITHEFPWEELPHAIETAGDVEHALNVVIKY